MEIELKPFSRDSLLKIVKGNIVKNPTIGKSAKGISSTVVSDMNFGDTNNHSNKLTKKRDMSIYYSKGIIPFSMKVPNYFILGSRLDLLSKLFNNKYLFKKYGISKLTVNKIISCDVYFDNKDNVMIMPETHSTFNNMEYDIERYVFGGDLLYKVIKDLDLETELEAECITYANMAMSAVVQMHASRTLRKSDKDLIRVVRTETDFHIIDDYYLDVSELILSDNVLKTLDIADIINTYNKSLETILYEGMLNKRLRYLLSLKINDGAYDNLLNSIQDFCVVMPVGFRPDTSLGINLINKAYSNLITAANDLEQELLNHTAKFSSVIDKYKELLKMYKYLTIDHDEYHDFSNRNMKDYRDVKSQLISKEGQIRSVLQSETVDCSARTVIITDPHMSIDTIGVPYNILRHLFEYKFIEDLNERSKGGITPVNKLQKLEFYGLDTSERITNAKIDEFAKLIPSIVGRQPTLWKYGIQGFKIKPVKGNAIILPPLCVSAFNADFDGDQMHINIPVSLAAVKEVKDTMMNVNNIYLMRDGSCHIYPRHEIIYGLWVASKAKPIGKVVIKCDKLSAAIIKEIHEAVINDYYALTDVVQIGQYKYSLGVIAVKSCGGMRYVDYIIGTKDGLRKSNKLGKLKDNVIPSDEEDQPLTEKWCIDMLTKIHEDNNGVNNFVNTVNNWTIIGTSVATYYPPNLNIKHLPDIRLITKEFNKQVEKLRRLFILGIHTESAFRREYSALYSAFDDAVEKLILKEDGASRIDDDNVFKPVATKLGNTQYLGDNNGFKLMADSKCRGNKSTIKQVFCMKGRVMKNSNESFNSIISNSMARGLGGLEHYTTAYGGRQGQIDKSIETATPGYITRMIAVAANEIVIRSDDCGTTNGLLLNYSRLRMHYVKSNTEELVIYQEAMDFFRKIVVGRYLVEKTDQEVSDEDVDSLFRSLIADVDSNGNIIVKAGCHMRSPLTCEDPCCRKCYGINPGTHKPIDIGHAVGYEASQSIGQPGTQLTMKNFQSGGVVGEGNLTSSFDLTQKYLELTDLNSQCKKGTPIVTDILSPVDAKVEQVYIQGHLKIVNLINETTRKAVPGYTNIIMYASTRLKDNVKAGETICQDIGDLNIDNVRDCSGIDGSIYYLLTKLWQIFNREVNVQIKHFEVLLSSMIFYVCKKSNGYYKAGQSYTMIEYMTHGGKDNADKFYKTIVSVKQVADNSPDILRSVLFEDLLDAVRKHIITNNTDECKDQYVRMSLGLKPTISTNVNGGD